MTTSIVRDQRERAIRAEVHAELRRTIDADEWIAPGTTEVETARRLIAERIAAANRSATTLGEPPIAEPEVLAQRLYDDLLGLGPLQVLLDDPSIEEIIVSGPQRVFAIADGRKRLTDTVFEDDEQLLRVVRRAVGPLGRRLDETSPMVDARLPDGSRLNAVMPPLTSGSVHVTMARPRSYFQLVSSITCIGRRDRKMAESLGERVIS